MTVATAATGAAGESPQRPTRRTVLTGGLIGLGGALAGAGFLIQGDGSLGAIHHGSFDSPARGGRPTGWVIAYPPGVDPDHPVTASGARLPVCVVLHGRGDEAASIVPMGYPAYLATAVHQGLPPFALAAADGHESYWHRRADGDDPGRMVLQEWLPRLADLGLAARPVDRVGFLGWSMGGYGSLLLASRLGPGRVAGIVAESPALWLRPEDSARGAFDSADDFRANDVFGRRAVLSRIPIRIDCGTADPFHTAAQRFAAGLDPRPITDLGAGDHTWGYWRSKAPKAINFIGNAFEEALPAD